MKNILIPTDFSENSQDAIRYALDYFSDIPANFYILHVSLKTHFIEQHKTEVLLDVSENSVPVYNPSSRLQSQIETCKLLSKNSMHEFFPITENTLLVEAIRKQVVEKEIDLIIMGTKGDSLSSSDDMGSNTYEVITKVQCPIIVVPEDSNFNGIKNIAFVTDYNCLYRSKVISTLTDALRLHNTPLRVLNIRAKSANLTQTQIDNKGFLHHFFKETRHSFHILENINLEAGIQEFVDTWEISMVAIPAKNLNFIQRLMLRPASGNINYHSEVPFLVLHE